MATNRLPKGAKGNAWIDSAAYLLLVAMVAELQAIASSLTAGLGAWLRGAGVVVLGNTQDRVGIGTGSAFVTSKLEVAGRIATAHRLYTHADAFPAIIFATAFDSWLEGVLAAAGGLSWSLPAAATCPGRELLLSLTSNAGIGTLKFLSPAGDTFDGGASPSLSVAGDYARIKSDGGTNWKILEAKVAGARA